MSYKEDHAMELETLEAIYADDYELLTGPDEGDVMFTIVIHNKEADLTITPLFTFPPGYPYDEPLILGCSSSENMPPDQVDAVIQSATDCAAENVGMQSTFTIVSHIIEELNVVFDKIIAAKAEEQRKKDWRDADKSKMDGVMCTVETFLKWKEGFLKEMADAESSLLSQKSSIDPNLMKPTGKELFLQDSTLFNSDVGFEGESGDIEEFKSQLLNDNADDDVDEALFQAIDLLDPDELAELE